MSKSVQRLALDALLDDPDGILDALRRQDSVALIERDGHWYRLEPVTRSEAADPWANYDPERVQAAIRQSAGALAGVDREQLLADLRAQRGQADRDASQ